MALFGRKKKEETPPDMPPATGMYPDQGYADQGYGDYGQGYGQYPPEAYPPESYPQGQYPQGAPMAQQPPMAPPSSEPSKENVEEIAEAIVEEKWKEKEKEINKILEWKEEMTTKLTQLQQQMDDLKASFDSLHKGMLGKITEYDENLTNVGTEIKAMEKVFSKVLPSLTDSVNKLQRMSGPVKKK